jgi:uncharacterized membrane protein YdjX (TVP38/TMEM64 family)
LPIVSIGEASTPIPGKSALIKLAVLIALIAAAVSFTRNTETGRQITFLAIRDYVASYPPLVVPLLYIGIYIAGTVCLLPGTVLSFVCSRLFGLFEATLYTWIGATIGATPAFLLAKLLSRDFVNQLLGGRLQALDDRLRRHGFTGLLILRLVPIFPFNAINFGSGLTSIRLVDYVLATAIGILPGTFAYQYLFAKLGDKVLSGEYSLSDVYDPELLIAVGVFVVFIIAGKWPSAKLQPPSEPRPSGSGEPTAP